MLDELLAHAGVEERLELRSAIGFLAIHGGSLERDTDRVAAEAAEWAGASLYALLLPEDLRWHIPSALIDPAHSPALARFVAHVDSAVSVHGYGRQGMFTSVLLGGRNRDLARHLAGHLRPHLPGYEVVDDLDAIPAALRGLHPDNPVNRPAGAGVQVELPPRIRGQGPNADPAAREALVVALGEAAAAWPAAP